VKEVSVMGKYGRRVRVLELDEHLIGPAPEEDIAINTKWVFNNVMSLA